MIGAGLMGAGMAHRLIAAGHPVTVMAHRNRAPIDSLLSEGAAEAPDTAALLAGCDVLLTCLPNADVVERLADEIVPILRDGQIWIDATTSRPETSVGLAVRVAERNAIFADAPVTGGPPQAMEGTLASLVGCAEAHFSAIEALVRPYSKVVRRFGAPGRGHAAKLLNNLVTQGTMVLLADANQCAAAYGIDARALYDVMMTGAGRSGTLEKAVGPALDGDYNGARFSIANATKDLGYASDLVAAVDPDRAALASILFERLKGLVERGQGDKFVSTMLDPNSAK